MTAAPGETRSHIDATLRLAAGTLVAGRYRIEGFLGIGGMGMVYRAHDEELDVPVALKLLRPELGRDPDLVERLRREVVTARQVSHKNVVRIHDIGQDGELSFLTMDFVDGRSLRRLVEQEGALAAERAEHLLRQIAEGLAAAHAAGVVHRDLTPSNVLVDATDRAWITDFGLARTLARSGMTREGVVVGTLDYLAPEQARGEAADGRSDLYALGVILFEMLSGELPFPGGSWSETLAQRLHGRPRALGELGVTAPPALARVVRRCLERDPRRRYASAAELVADLDGRLARRGRIRRSLAVAAVVVALVAAGALVWRGTRHGGTASRPAAPARAAPAVAVLPLADETGRPELAWIAPALAEQLSEALAEEPDLRVVAHGRLVRAIRDLHLGGGGWSATELHQVAGLFAANRVVAGAVRTDGARMLVELRVADGEGRELGSAKRIEASVAPADLAGLATRLASELERRFDVAELRPPRRPVPPDAFATYAEGAARLASGDALGAAQRLEVAVREDAGFGAAWLRLAEARERLGDDDAAREAATRAAALVGAGERRLRLETAALLARLAGHPDAAAKQLADLAGLFPHDADLAVAAGDAAASAGDYDAAEGWLARAVALDPQQPRGWYLRGKVAILAGHPQVAVDDYLVRALVIQNKLGNDQGRADVLNGFGVAYKQLGKLDRADGYYGQAEELRRRLGDQRGVATTLRNLSTTAAIRGDYERSDARLAEAQAILEKLDDRSGIADVMNERGVLEEERGRAERALDDYRRALDLRRKLGDPAGLAESLNNVGYASFLLGRYDDAGAYWQQALDLDRKTGNEQAELLARQSLAELALARGEWQLAAKQLLATLDRARSIGFDPAVAVSLGELGRLAEYEGRFDAALASYGQAETLLTRLDDARGLVEYELGEAETWLELDEPVRAIERLDVAAGRLAGGSGEQRALLDALRARALAARGDAAGAEHAVALGRREAAASGSRAAAVALDVAAGETALAAGRSREGRRALGAAVAAAVALDHAWLELHAREDLARAEVAAGDRDGAERELRAALRRADRCGLYARRWRLDGQLARLLPGSPSPEAERVRAAARTELQRVLATLDAGERRRFAAQEAARELL